MQLLKEIPRERAEWVAWMDMDIVIDDMLFDIPLHKYEGKDFIIWGQQDKITRGDVLNGGRPGLSLLAARSDGVLETCRCLRSGPAGVSSGVFLVRNTDWSRSFLGAWVPFGTFPPNHTYDEVGAHSVALLPPLRAAVEGMHWWCRCCGTRS